MEKEYKYLPAGISLSAGLIISIVRIVNKGNSLQSLILVLSFILGFYIIGLIFRYFLIKFKTKEEEKTDSTEDELNNVDTENTENTVNQDDKKEQ